jgi:hypothetical protein
MPPNQVPFTGSAASGRRGSHLNAGWCQAPTRVRDVARGGTSERSGDNHGRWRVPGRCFGPDLGGRGRGLGLRGVLGTVRSASVSPEAVLVGVRVIVGPDWDFGAFWGQFGARVCPQKPFWSEFGWSWARIRISERFGDGSGPPMPPGQVPFTGSAASGRPGSHRNTGWCQAPTRVRDVAGVCSREAVWSEFGW